MFVATLSKQRNLATGKLKQSRDAEESVTYINGEKRRNQEETASKD